MGKFIFRHDYIILDACCVINLYASGMMLNILESAPVRFAIADYVHDKEVLKTYTGPNNDVTQTSEVVDLRPFCSSKLITVVSPSSDDEFLDYVDFVANRLDDGEALTGAIAKHRNWGIGIDERRGISFFSKETPQLQLISTPQLIKCWVDSAGPSCSEISDVIRNVRGRARYYPSSEHPLYQWWDTYRDCY